MNKADTHILVRVLLPYDQTIVTPQFPVVLNSQPCRSSLEGILQSSHQNRYFKQYVQFSTHIRL